MRIGLGINYAGGFKELAAEVADLERAGLDVVFVPEAYSFDAVSALGYLAASTERVQLASGILQLYTRTPTLTAMTAAGLDYVSDGRFTLGLGASGPQVIEGFHGVPYDAPIARTREIIDICRQVWRLVLELLSGCSRRFSWPNVSIFARRPVARLEVQRALSLVAGDPRIFPLRGQKTRPQSGHSLQQTRERGEVRPGAQSLDHLFKRWLRHEGSLFRALHRLWFEALHTRAARTERFRRGAPSHRALAAARS